MSHDPFVYMPLHTATGYVINYFSSRFFTISEEFASEFQEILQCFSVLYYYIQSDAYLVIYRYLRSL